jgi:hypothetical protein
VIHASLTIEFTFGLEIMKIAGTRCKEAATTKNLNDSSLDNGNGDDGDDIERPGRQQTTHHSNTTHTISRMRQIS